MRVIAIVLPCAACFTTPPAPPCAAGAWGAPSRLAELATTDDEDGPWMSADRTHVVFSSKHVDGSTITYSVLEASRGDAKAPFDPPVALPELVTDLGKGPPADRLEPFMSEDLREIWLGRRLQTADESLGAAVRAGPGNPFGTPSPASLIVQCMPDGCGVNTSNDEFDPSFSPDLRTIYFGSDRATGQYRLYAAQGTAPGLDWSEASLLPISSDASLDRAPAITPDGSMLLFETDRAGGRAIFESERTGPGLADFAPPIPFAPLADGYLSGSPYVLPDGNTIIYWSDHNDGNGRDLYLVERCD